MSTESFETPLCELMGYCDDSSYATRLCTRLKAAHEREIRDMAQREFARGMDAGRHSMDAEHRAVAMRLRHLPLDGGSHENLSQIARAVYHSDFGWTQGACAALRDELVRLMGGASDDTAEPMTTDEFIEYVEEDTRRLKSDATRAGDGDDTCGSQCRGACTDCDGGDSGKQVEVNDGGTADDSAAHSRGGSGSKLVHLDGLTTYDVLDNERRKAVCELSKIPDNITDARDTVARFYRLLAESLGVDTISFAAVRDRLIHLLGGDQPSGIDVLRAMDEREAECRITDELREFVGTFSKRLSINVAEVNAIADRIDEQFDRICQQQEAVLQSTIAELVEQRDAARARTDELSDELLRTRRERDELQEKWAELSAELSHQCRRTELACGAVYSAERERDKLRKRLDAITAALNG